MIKEIQKDLQGFKGLYRGAKGFKGISRDLRELEEYKRI